MNHSCLTLFFFFSNSIFESWIQGSMFCYECNMYATHIGNEQGRLLTEESVTKLKVSSYMKFKKGRSGWRMCWNPLTTGPGIPGGSWIPFIRDGKDIYSIISIVIKDKDSKNPNKKHQTNS